MRPIAILGSGPAGLLAALAVGLSGRPLAIFSNQEKSQLGGAQFLHSRIPDITNPEPDATVTYRVAGDAQTYREKVYGDDPTVPFVSFSGVTDGATQEAWSLKQAYDNLWYHFGSTINEATINPAWLDEHGMEFDLILSTVPLPAICRTRAGLGPVAHRFTVQEILISTDKEYVACREPDTIMYDGTKDHSWYRSSNLFGCPGTEWSTVGRIPPIPNLIRDRKPIATDCDCWEGKVVRLGRRGTWTKGVLTHHAFVEAMKLFMPEAADAL